MSKLKKLVLVVVVLLFILPMFLCLYTTLLLGNSLVGQQWLVAYLLFVVGLFLLQIVGIGMK